MFLEESSGPLGGFEISTTSGHGSGPSVGVRKPSRPRGVCVVVVQEGLGRHGALRGALRLSRGPEAPPAPTYIPAPRRLAQSPLAVAPSEAPLHVSPPTPPFTTVFVPSWTALTGLYYT